jgi:hypothetical protein
VVFAKMPWEVSFAGIPDQDQGWQPNGAYIYLNGETGYPGNLVTGIYTPTILADGSVRVVGDGLASLYNLTPWLNATLDPSRRNFDDGSWKTITTTKRFTVDDLVLLPKARKNSFYSVSNKICGEEGAPPYGSWTIIGTPIPGLTLSPTGNLCATLSGTPTTIGSYTFDVQATDSANITSTGNYILRVNQ